MKDIKLIIISLLILICCIGAASAADDNSTLMNSAEDVVLEADDLQDTSLEINNEETNTLETDENIENLGSLSYSGTEVEAEDWDELKEYSEYEDDDYVITLTGTIYAPSNYINFKNSATIIGTANSYITAGTYTGTPFINTDSALTLNFINVTFRDMSVTNLLELAGTKNLENCNFYNITAGTGHNAVIYNTIGTMNLNNCNIINSSAGYGVVSNYNSGTTTGVVMNVNECTFVRNSANVEPGAINNCGILNVDNSQFINNTAAWWAGAIHTHYNARTIINNSHFEGNDAGWNGGALYTYSTLKVYNTQFKKNKCHTNIGGGAIGASRWWAGNYDITIENCTFEENENCHSNGNGGAITAMNSGALNVHDSTFINNKATNGQAIAAFSKTFENITAGIPNLKVYNNTFYNHTLTTSNTVEISGNYTFENNTFYNCYQPNLENNIANNPVNSVSDNLLIKKINEPILKSIDINELLKEDLDTIYVNISSSNSPKSVDGQSWENAYGTKTGISKALSNIKDGGIIYLADGEYTQRSINVMKNITIIGQSKNTILGLQTTAYGVNVDITYTFINITLRDDVSKKGNHYNNYEINTNFINCTFINSTTIEKELNEQDQAHVVEYGYAKTYVMNFDNCEFKGITTDNGIITLYQYGLVNFTNCNFEDITADSIVAKNGTFYLDDGIYFHNCNFSNCNVKGIVDIPGNYPIETYCAIEDCDYDFDAKLGNQTVGDFEHNYVNATKLKVVAVETTTSIESAENGIVTITVKDNENKTVANAEVNYTVNDENRTGVTDENGTITISDLTGQTNITANFNGNESYLASNNTASFAFKVKTALTSAKVTATYKVAKNLVITLKDSNGNVLVGKTVNVKVGSITKNLKTNAKGQVSVNVATLVPKTYTATIKFAGDDSALASTLTVKNIVVKKAAPKLTTKKLTTKVKVKTKKVTATLKDNKGKVLKNTKITLKIKGVTYKATTNKKGVATFKVTKLNKKGTFKGTVKFAGNKYFKAASKKVTVVVKK